MDDGLETGSYAGVWCLVFGVGVGIASVVCHGEIELDQLGPT